MSVSGRVSNNLICNPGGVEIGAARVPISKQKHPSRMFFLLLFLFTKNPFWGDKKDRTHHPFEGVFSQFHEFQGVFKVILTV